MSRIFYSRIHNCPKFYSKKWSIISSGLEIRVKRYRNPEDQLRFLIGRQLLKFSVKNVLAGDFQSFNKLNYTSEGRPFLPNSTADFNISHSGDYVVCVLSPNSRVGIDVEYKREVGLSDFTRTMNQHQWSEIHKSQDSFDTFFKYWTMKESVIKADGRGLSIPLTDIIFENNQVFYQGNQWHLHPFQIDTNHPGCVASNKEINDLQLVEVHWKEFLE